MRKLASYILVFDSTQVASSRLAIHQYIQDSKDFAAYWNYIPLVYMVKSHLTATEISEKIFRVIAGTHFVVAEINSGNINGILPRPAWDWINTDHSQPPPPLDWGQLLKALEPPRRTDT